MLWLKQYPWFTLLFALYSPMALIAFNVGQVPFSAVIRSALIILVSVFILTSLMILLVGDAPRAGLIVSLALALFFSYGHVYELIAKADIGGFLVGRHRFLILLYLGILFGAVIWVVRRKRSFARWSSALMTIAMVLLIFPVYQLIAYEIKLRSTGSVTSSDISQVIQYFSDQKLPDVYYIILDTYGRTDVLKKYTGYDNTPFIETLQKLGFYVATCSQSNYSQTGLSLASSLNFRYLDQLGLTFSDKETKREDAEAPFIKHNAVVDYMRSMGYRIIAFETGYEFSTLDDSDTLYPTQKSGISDFELVLLRSTALVLLDEAGMIDGIHPTSAQNRRNTILYQLKTLKNLPADPGPKFVFAHLLIPHWPFIFGPNGESLLGSDFVETARGVSDQEYFEGYRGQTIFTSNQILDVVSEIIQKSDVPPIIVLQGDHGPAHAGVEARMAILNAYYFPGGRQLHSMRILRQ